MTSRGKVGRSRAPSLGIRPARRETARVFEVNLSDSIRIYFCRKGYPNGDGARLERG